MKHVLFCKKCNNFTIKLTCCGEKTESLKPLKYSPVDKYVNYRREAKRKELEEKGLL